MVASFEDPDPEHIQHVVVLDWFVAGDIPAVGQLPFTGTATYTGTAIGTVATDLFPETGVAIPGSDGWTTYVATGDLNMDWNFGTRKGSLEISNFDAEHFTNDGGLTFGGPMCAPGVTSGCGQTPNGAWKTPDGNHFGGPLKLTNASQLPVQLRNEFTNFDGFALGSFVRGPTNYVEGVAVSGSTPQGVIGNWAIGSERYMASGIFAGSHVIPTQ
jgi:hypothetical protein